MFQIVPQLTVRDMTRSREFYVRHLGFGVTQADPLDNPVFIAMERDEATLFLVSESSREDVNQKELSANKRGVGVRLYFEVDDARVQYDQLQAAGIAITRDIAYNEEEDYTEFSFPTRTDMRSGYTREA